jgi:hypothetical protein
VRIGWGVRIFVAVALLGVWPLAALYGAGPRNATIGVAVMAGSIFGFVFGLAAFVFVGILVHELGHAIANVVLTPGRALIEIGAPPRAWRFSIGRIDFNLGPGRGEAHCVVSPTRSRAREVMIVAAGPLASALFAGALVVAAVRLHASDHDDLTVYFLFGAMLQLIATRTNLKAFEIDRPDDDGRPRRLLSDGALIRRRLQPEPGRAPLTRRAEIAVGAALRLAQQAGDAAVTTEHVLRGVAATDAHCAQLLREVGYRSDDTVPEPVEDVAPPPPAAELDDYLETVSAQRSLPGRAEVDAEDLLLAIVRTPGTAGHAALVAAGVDVGALRTRLIGAMSSNL